MTIHKSVLLEETIENLNLKSGDAVVDATLGGGGHSREILKKIGNQGTLIAIDQDKEAIEEFKRKNIENIILINDNFANLKNILTDSGIEKVDAIAADLGISSDQLNQADRGFSFMSESELDMRMDQSQRLSAKVIVNTYQKEDLVKIFRDFGDERYANGIAKNICEERKKKPIRTTKELVSIIEKSVPGDYKHRKIHFATRIFQSLRIETNDEMENLKKFIPDAIDFLKSEGRLAIITFHSGEDRIVKNLFRQYARGCICPKNFPVCRCGKESKIRIVSKKPILPSAVELEKNPRARSAKLRVLEKI
jgi:16S rRNA (cytosine1402-N4)-methyltransferase